MSHWFNASLTLDADPSRAERKVSFFPPHLAGSSHRLAFIDLTSLFVPGQSRSSNQAKTHDGKVNVGMRASMSVDGQPHLFHCLSSLKETKGLRFSHISPSNHHHHSRLCFFSSLLLPPTNRLTDQPCLQTAFLSTEISPTPSLDLPISTPDLSNGPPSTTNYQQLSASSSLLFSGSPSVSPLSPRFGFNSS